MRACEHAKREAYIPLHSTCDKLVCDPPLGEASSRFIGTRISERESAKRGKTLRLRFQRFRNGSLRHAIIASLVLLGRSRLPDSCNYVFTACVYHDVRKLENLRDLLRNLHPAKCTGNATTETRRSKEINFRK